MFKTTHMLLNDLEPSFDLVVRSVPEAEIEVVFISTMVDLTRVEERLLGPLTSNSIKKSRNTITWLQNTLQLTSIQRSAEVRQAVRALLENKAVLCLPREFVLVDVQGLIRRTPKEPSAEMSIRGSRDGFTESMDTNVSLVRSRLKDPKLSLKQWVLGERTQTRVLLIYIQDLANPRIVDEVERRLGQIHVDGVIDSGTLEQWIEDNHWSPYPQLQSTERPDKVAASLLEGRMAILVDGTPFALLAPAVMVSFFQTTDDYAQRWISGTAMRFTRMVALAMSIFAPSLYIALTMYNPELIPVKMVLQLAATREGIPLPILLEALFMEVMVELVREAGNRMPQQMGQSFTIVGGLVIGDIAVQAGVVSPIMVVAVGLTALGAFAIPNYEAAFVTRMVRFPMLLMTAMFGVIGTLGFALVLIAHLCTLKSFGIPYLTPFTQLALLDWQDTLIRGPVQLSTTRPATYWSPRAWLGRGRYKKRKEYAPS